MSALMNRRSSIDGLGLAAAPFRPGGDGDRDKDDKPDEQLAPIGGDADQNGLVLQDREQRDAEDRAEHGADAARQARPAEYDSRQHVEFLADEHGRRHRLGELRLNERSDARHKPEIAIDEAIEAEDVEAEALRRVLVAAHRVDLPPYIGAVE